MNISWQLILFSGLAISLYKIIKDYFLSLITYSLTIEDKRNLGNYFIDFLSKNKVVNSNYNAGEHCFIYDPSKPLCLSPGFYYLIYKSKLIFLKIDDFIPNNAGWDLKRHPIIKLITFRWNKYIIDELFIEANKPNPMDSFVCGNQIANIGDRYRDGFKNLILPDNLTERFTTLTTWFYSKKGKETFSKLSQPYKYVILLSGLPGTGKTSIAKAISDVAIKNFTNLKIVSDNQCDISSETIGFLIRNPDSIILIDEIDKLFQIECKSKLDITSLHAILNGDYSHGHIIILTANNLDLIPEQYRESLFRSKRIDFIYDFGPATKEQRNEVIKRYNINPVDIEDCIVMSDIMEKVSMKEITRI